MNTSEEKAERLSSALPPSAKKSVQETAEAFFQKIDLTGNLFKTLEKISVETRPSIIANMHIISTILEELSVWLNTLTAEELAELNKPFLGQ